MTKHQKFIQFWRMLVNDCSCLTISGVMKINGDLFEPQDQANATRISGDIFYILPFRI